MKIFSIAAASVFTAAILTSCSLDEKVRTKTDVKVIREYSKNAVIQRDFLFDTPKELSAVSVGIETGNITIENSLDDKTGIALDCKAFADSDETCQEVLSHVSAKTEINGNTMTVKFIENETGDDISEWLEKNIPDCRIELDAYITVPTYIESFSASADVGNLVFSGLSGSFSSFVDVGNITCTDIEITDISKISGNTSNIQMLETVYTADTDIKATTGNIAFELPLSGSDNADVSIFAETGNITVSGGEFTPVNEKTDENSHSMTVNHEGCNISISVQNGKITKEKE